MLLARWFKRSSQPTYQTLKKTIIATIFDITLPETQCENKQHNTSFKQYYCVLDQTKTLMCVDCCHEHKLTCPQNCLININHFKKQQLERFLAVCQQIQTSKHQNDQIYKIPKDEVQSSQSNIFDIFQDIFSQIENINKAIPSDLHALQVQNNQKILRIFNNLIEANVNITESQYESKEYEDKVREVIHEFSKGKQEFKFKKQQMFREGLRRLLKKIRGQIDKLSNGYSCGEEKQREQFHEKIDGGADDGAEVEVEVEIEVQNKQIQTFDFEDLMKNQYEIGTQTQINIQEEQNIITNSQKQIQSIETQTPRQPFQSPTQPQPEPPSLEHIPNQNLNTLVNQNNSLNLRLSSITNQLQDQKLYISQLEAKINDMDLMALSRAQEIKNYQRKMKDVPDIDIHSLDVLRRQVQLQSEEKDKYYNMFLSKSAILKQYQEEVDKLTEFTNEMKQYYQNKRKTYKSQLASSQTYQMKLQNEFQSLQRKYSQSQEQLEIAINNINLLEQLNQQLKAKYYQKEESTLKKSLSSSQLSHKMPRGDLQSKLISKFQKFWIAEIVEQYLNKPIQFKNISNRSNFDQNQQNNNCLGNKYESYLTIVKVHENCVVGWYTPDVTLSDRQLFFNASQRKTFEWTRLGDVNTKTIGLQGDNGFELRGNQIKTNNFNLINKAFEIKGNHQSIKIMKYELHEVI